MAEVWQFVFQDPMSILEEIINFQHKKYIQYLNCIIYYLDNILIYYFICRDIVLCRKESSFKREIDTISKLYYLGILCVVM